MFTQGQSIFTICFIVGFIIIIGYAYRKDIAIHRKNYKKSYQIVFLILLFLAVFIYLKRKFIGV